MGDIRILVADDQPIMSQALKTFIDQEHGMTCVGTATNGREAVRMNGELRPNIVLMDMQMPVMNGVEATTEITAGANPAKVIAITTFEPAEYLLPVLRAGAEGFLLKDARPEEVVTAIRSVHQGNAAVSPAAAALLINAAISDRTIPDASAAQEDNTQRGRQRSQTPSTLIDPITPREHEVLKLLGQGMSNRDMSKQLFIAEATIKAHVSNLMVKFNARNRVELLVTSAKEGLIEIASS